MNCENIFCLYQQKGKCTLDEIDIDASGRCTEMIFIDVDDRIISESKTNQLNKIDNNI